MININNKEKFKKLQKELRTYTDKRDYLKNKIKDYSNLEHRSKCPHCDQDINYKDYMEKLPTLLEELKLSHEKIESLLKEIKILQKPILEEQELKSKEHKKKVEEYLILNKNMLNKAIRDYRKGIENYLPLNITTKEEKELWNEAMELQLDNRNIDENEELYYEI